eukprot:GILK01004803.1.p2 GENE.GILK01004803.1~~GILK01004803.1.p2  ORF type:complete len:144 (-),score=17.98 GILK01004803.1:1324-1713(-)
MASLRRFFSTVKLKDHKAGWSLEGLLQQPDTAISVDIDRIFRLSAIEVSSPALKQQAMTDFSKTLRFLEQIAQVDTTNVEPLVSICDYYSYALPTRDDSPAATTLASDVLKNAPATTDSFFVVPKTVDV